MPGDSRRVPYLPAVDGLRALAVLAVIVNHFEPGLLPGGYLGVDVFFVISGFVITRSLLSQNRAGSAAFLLAFYARRFKRLAPALILFVLTMSVAVVLLDPIPTESLNTGKFALFGAANLYLMSIATDYFARSTELNAFTHTWSLGVEEQFYLVYPLLVWALANRDANERRLSRALLALSAASLIGFAALYGWRQPLAYFLMPTRFWELGAGGLVCLLQRGRWAEAASRAPASLAAALLALTFLAQPSVAVLATIAAVLCAATLIAGFRPQTLAYRLFAHPAAVRIGLWSYSLYLWHWGVLAVSRWTIGVQMWTVPLQIALIAALAGLSYRYVERPLRSASWARREATTVGYALAASAAAFGLVVTLAGPVAQALKSSTTPDYLQHTWWIDRDTGKYLEKCHVEYRYSPAYLGECLEDRSPLPHVYLLGDSHARNYLPAVRAAFPEAEVKYLTMGHQCGFLPSALMPTADDVHCQAYVDDVVAFLTDHVRGGDVVVVGQKLMEEKARQTPLYVDFVAAFAGRMAASGAVTVLLDDVAPPEKAPDFCIGRFADVTGGCSIARAEVADAYAAFDGLARQAARDTPTLYYAPLRLGLCRSDLCGQISPLGAPIWHDRGHITEAAARELAPLLRQTLANQNFHERPAAPDR